MLPFPVDHQGTRILHPKDARPLSRAEQQLAHNNQNARVEGVNPDVVHGPVVREQQPCVGDAGGHPAGEEGAEGPALAGQGHGPDEKPGGEVAAADAREEDGGGGPVDLDDAEGAAHAGGVEETVDAGAYEEGADHAGCDFERA